MSRVQEVHPPGQRPRPGGRGDRRGGLTAIVNSLVKDIITPIFGIFGACRTSPPGRSRSTAASRDRQLHQRRDQLPADGRGAVLLHHRPGEPADGHAQGGRGPGLQDDEVPGVPLQDPKTARRCPFCTAVLVTDEKSAPETGPLAGAMAAARPGAPAAPALPRDQRLACRDRAHRPGARPPGSCLSGRRCEASQGESAEESARESEGYRRWTRSTPHRANCWTNLGPRSGRCRRCRRRRRRPGPDGHPGGAAGPLPALEQGGGPAPAPTRHVLAPRPANGNA